MMKRYESEIELLRCLYYALDLPVRLTVDGESYFSMPEKIVTAGSVGANEELSSYGFEEGGAQYLRTPGGENYIVLRLDDRAGIAAGPFLTERPPESFFTDMVRGGKIKLRFAPAMKAHFDALPLVSGQKFFYAGKLMETVFSSVKGSDAPAETEGLSAVFIQPDYYRQTKDYRANQFLHSPYMVEQEICRTISNGDTDAAHRILKEINSRPRARLAGSALRSLKNSVICSCSFMTRAAISGGVSPDEAFTLSDTYIQRIENCGEIQELMGFEDEMVNGFTMAVNDVKNRRYSNAVSQAIAYIDTHLCEPLTVQAIADAVYLSPNYLSRLFLRETGETVHSCIVRRRIEEAAYFVRSSSDTLADIASFYQFSSQSHFVQSFKRVMGVTPGTYRRSTTLTEE